MQNANAQTLHCKPDFNSLGLVPCTQESPFDDPKLIAERNRKECLSALKAQSAVIDQLAELKSGKHTTSAALPKLLDQYKNLSKKIGKVCGEP